MNECPNCRQKTIRNFDKLMLGPGSSIKCKNCGAEISISWWSAAIFMFVLIVLWFSKDKVERSIFIPSMLAAWCVYFYIHMKHIPLIVKKRDEI